MAESLAKFPPAARVKSASEALQMGNIAYTEHSSRGPPAASTTLPPEGQPDFLSEFVLADCGSVNSSIINLNESPELSDRVTVWVLGMLYRLGYEEYVEELRKIYEENPPLPPFPTRYPAIMCESWTVTPGEHPLADHNDNVNGHDQVTFVVYPQGGWKGGELRIITQRGPTVSESIASTNDNGWVVVAFGGDVEHLPTAPSEGERKCVVFHVGKVRP